MTKKLTAKLYHLFIDHNLLNKLLIILTTISLILLSATIFSFYGYKDSGFKSDKFSILIILNGLTLLSVLILITKKIYDLIFSRFKKSKLRARIILMFSIVAAIPTILVSAFSIIFFYLGIQSWFDVKVSTAIETSVKVAELHIKENKFQLKEKAKSLAHLFEEMYYEVIHNPELSNEFLNFQVEMRGLNEAILFQKSSNYVLAKSKMSYSLMFFTPNNIIYPSDIITPIEIESDPSKIRVIIKLGGNFEDTYLLIGKIIDPEVTNYVNQTNGVGKQYMQMRDEVNQMQISFAYIFIFLSIILLALTITLGAIFGNYIAKPLMKLVKATDLVKSGDFTVRVTSSRNNDDEIDILTNAFNKMVRKIDLQQKDLVLAQRSLAWSDVARRVAHEIKNPLTPIMLSAERLSKKFITEVEDKESFKRYVNSILRHTIDIQKIVAEFTNFAKLPSPQFEKLDIISLIKDLVESRIDINDKYCYKFATNVDRFVFDCDKTQINQVVTNLFKNAEESLENKEGERVIFVEICNLEDDLEITFKDNGSGFSEELINKATEPYFTTRSKGSGLGLAIVKKIVQDHGGKVEILNSEEGGGVVRLIFEHKKVNN